MMSVRTPLGATDGAKAWERIIGGRRYWFNATPYEVKVFRLSLQGGDLVHHWRDAPEVIGECDRYDRSTYPRPGQVAWQRHWDPNNSERLYVTACRVCGDIADVTREHLVANHGDSSGARTCDGSGTAATRKAATLRDSQLNREERRVNSAVGNYLSSCRGFDSITGEQCHHPICGVRREAGLHWTLSGWRA